MIGEKYTYPRATKFKNSVKNASLPMPAIITHHQFAREMLNLPATSFIKSVQERNAFLLGSQGPDPLFFCVVSPSLYAYRALGSLMHDKKPGKLLHVISGTPALAPSNMKKTVQAYCAGFLCHYLLDRAAHPFVYAQQFALCNAGIDGLDERDGHEVHAVIESELDEMILYTHEGLTISSFKPYKEILKADEQSLAAISHAVCATLWETYEKLSPAHLFSASVHNYRRVQFATYSPRGIKRTLYGVVERRFKRHSFAQAFCHRPLALTESIFDNHEHRVWIDPFTNAKHTTSFEDIFNNVLEEANSLIPRFIGETFIESASETSFKSASKDISQNASRKISEAVCGNISEGISLNEAEALACNLNFSGKPYSS